MRGSQLWQKILLVSIADFVNTQCQNLIEPHIYDKIIGDTATFTRGELLKNKRVDKFHDSEVPEINELQDYNIWGIMLRKRLHKCKKILRSVWAYRIKQNPDGTIKKYKSRLKADGSRQEQDIDYNTLYAPGPQ